MVCLGLEPGAAGWKAQTNPLSYGVTPKKQTFFKKMVNWYLLLQSNESNKSKLSQTIIFNGNFFDN